MDADPSDDAAKATMRALVVDDVPEICELYRSVFGRIRGLNVELVVETDPSEAIRRIRERSYDLVVSDFRMKNADGIDVLTAARESYPTGRRVLMTGYNEVPTSIVRIQQARIDAYLQKPLKTHDLLLMITDLLVGDVAQLERYRADADEMEAIAFREERTALQTQE